MDVALIRTLVLLAAAAAIAFGSHAPAFGEPPIPDSPPGRRFSEIIALVNAGDAAALERYVKTAFTPAMLGASPQDPGILPFLAGHQRDLGGFDVVRVLDASDEQVGVLVRTRREPKRTLRYVVGVEPSPPHRVQGLFLFPAPEDATGSADAGRAPLDAAGAVAEFDRVVKRLGDGGKFSGAFALARGGRIVSSGAYGEAERGFHAPNTIDTRFGVASLGKMFTALAIARLVEEGKLGWDDPVARRLDGWLPAELASRITVRHLLTHTSGLGDYLDTVFDGERVRLFPDVASYRPLFAGAELAAEPGTSFRYSNLGFVLLGAIVESVSGRDYFEFARDEVFARAGMTRTYWPRADEVVENYAVGYFESDEEGDTSGVWRSNTLLHGLRGTPAGGAVSTVGDLVAFANALTSGAIVSPATLDTLLVPRVHTPMGGDYGFGFLIERARARAGSAPAGPPEQTFGHSGGFPGAGATLRIGGDGWTLAVLSNATGGEGEVLEAWRGLHARLRASTPPAR